MGTERANDWEVKVTNMYGTDKDPTYVEESDESSSSSNLIGRTTPSKPLITSHQSAPLNLTKLGTQYERNHQESPSYLAPTPRSFTKHYERSVTPVHVITDSNSLHLGKANEGSPIQRIMNIEANNGVGRSQSGVHQNSLVQVHTTESRSEFCSDSNNGQCKASYTENALHTPENMYRTPLGTDEFGINKTTPTSFGGLFPRQESQNVTGQMSQQLSDIDVYRQSYMQADVNEQHSSNSLQQPDYSHTPVDFDQHQHGYSQEQVVYSQDIKDSGQQAQMAANHGQFNEPVPQPEPQMMTESERQVSGFVPYNHYVPSLEDQHRAAEQLASELVKQYGGKNSHMISDILKPGGEQGYVYGGFDRPGDLESIQPYDNGNQQVIHDVDLLNTPQQLPPVEEDYRGLKGDDSFGQPRGTSTPSTYKKPSNDYHGSRTYNDVHVHGGSWTSRSPATYVHSQQQQQQEVSEDPFPPDRNDDSSDENYGSYKYNPDDKEYCLRRAGNAYDSSGHRPRVPFQNQSQSNIPPSKHHSLTDYGSPNTSYQSGDIRGYQPPRHEVTKMTFTPREMMESHLSQNYQKKRAENQLVSETQYSSIYPSRDFIEQATHNPSRGVKRGNKQKSQGEKKKTRVSKYCTDDIPKVPPQMPIFDDMLQKYPPMLPRDEMHGGKHKYFVVNPSEITNMPAKNLITKYIDFLILENEQITEISKSTHPPVDIYVTEDMYFMDNLKFQVLFPSKKFIEWVASFYPKLNFFDMKFKGSKPRMPVDGEMMPLDCRPTQQILEDTFYYFQRELMNMENTKV